MRNCIFVGNTGDEATAVYNINSTVTLIGCTITSNVGIHATINSTGTGATIIHNSVVWDNHYGASSGRYILGAASVSYSNIQDGYPGQGNIDAAPMFVRDPDHGEPSDIYGWFERYEGSEDNDDFGDLRLSPGSPCVDMGSNDLAVSMFTDLNGHPRILDGDCDGLAQVDMGAYEFNYAYAGDLDCSCSVDFIDFSILAQAWQTHAGDSGWSVLCDIASPADARIDLHDLAVLTDHWLADF